MKPHFMIGDGDGGLYDTRLPNWSAKPLRPHYASHFPTIETAAQFKATLRAGGYAWPGGYSLAFATSDGSALCFDCARKEAQNILHSIAHDIRDGWKVAACFDADNQDVSTHCDHCNTHIGGEYYDD